VHPLGKGAIAIVTKRLIDIYRSDSAQAEYRKLLDGINGAAYSPDTPAELTLRRTRAGRYYLFALNPNLDAPIKGAVRVLGKFTGVCDLGIAQGFAIPSHYDKQTGYTEFKLLLTPGNFTVFSLD